MLAETSLALRRRAINTAPTTGTVIALPQPRNTCARDRPGGTMSGLIPCRTQASLSCKSRACLRPCGPRDMTNTRWCDARKQGHSPSLRKDAIEYSRSGSRSMWKTANLPWKIGWRSSTRKSLRYFFRFDRRRGLNADRLVLGISLRRMLATCLRGRGGGQQALNRAEVHMACPTW